MRLRIPILLLATAAGAYALFAVLDYVERAGGPSLALANTVGLFGVFVGLVAAFMILKRMAPPR